MLPGAAESPARRRSGTCSTAWSSRPPSGSSAGCCSPSRPGCSAPGTPDRRCPPILLAAVAAALAAGLTAIVLALRATGPGTSPSGSAAGIDRGGDRGDRAWPPGSARTGRSSCWLGAVAARRPGLLAGGAAPVRVADRPGRSTVDVTQRGTAVRVRPDARDGRLGGLPPGAAAATSTRWASSPAAWRASPWWPGSTWPSTTSRRYADRLAEREAHFRELAHTDPLTGLANRRGLLRALHDDAAERAALRAARTRSGRLQERQRHARPRRRRRGAGRGGPAAAAQPAPR